MTVERVLDEPRDQFPIGMRVLAVDDDPICLKLLEALLRRCQYHVTTTSQAITALKLLRENKDKFDLVISDVHMPDMDGFKLLELVGLEMDLPVIMLSVNGDHKLVMKGITHGACDYLLKPVRIEQLKNIWQHVIRRKKVDSKDQNSGNQDKSHAGSGEGGLGSVGTGNSDQNAKLNKKRKDQNDGEDEDHDEDEYENDDPSTQKKPRVVWSVELHRKFVAAVNQLGIDKAVPKKILDLMNVEKLTRENVASHLQKYRLYLKRISCVANQQANMVAALGTSDSSYLRTASMNGVGNYHSLTGPAQFHNNGYRSFPPNGMIGRLNTPAGVGLHCLPSSGMFQLGHAQNPSNSINDQPVMFPGNRNGNMLPAHLELDQQHSRGSTYGAPIYPNSSGFTDAKVTNRSNDPFSLTDNTLLRHARDSEVGRNHVMQSSVSMPSLKPELSPSFLDHGRLNDNWPTAAQSSAFRSNSFSARDSFKQPALLVSNLRDDMPVMSSQIGSSQIDVSSLNSIPCQSQDSRIGLQIPASTMSNNSGPTINNDLFLGWDEPKQDSPFRSDVMCSSMNNLMPVNDNVAPFDQNLDARSAAFQRNSNFNSIGQPNFVDVEVSTMDAQLKLKQQGYRMDQRKPQGGYVPHNAGSLDELVNSMMKQERR